MNENHSWTINIKWINNKKGNIFYPFFAFLWLPKITETPFICLLIQSLCSLERLFLKHYWLAFFFFLGVIFTLLSPFWYKMFLFQLPAHAKDWLIQDFNFLLTQDSKFIFFVGDSCLIEERVWLKVVGWINNIIKWIDIFLLFH